MLVSKRLNVVDALRGFAIVGIILVHNIEHFSLYWTPAGYPKWLKMFDKIVWDTIFYTFGGKVHVIFALLFGLTFYLQFENERNKGFDFRLRFFWRLILLFIIGIFNTVFYQGDILTFFAVAGLILIPFAKLNNKIVLVFAIFLLLKPFDWYQIFIGFQHPGLVPGPTTSGLLYKKAANYLWDTSMLYAWEGNLTYGKLAVTHWMWETGWFLQLAGMFLLGMLAGRKSVFHDVNAKKTFWIKTFIIAFIVFIPLYLGKNTLPGWSSSELINSSIRNLLTSWSSLAFTAMLVSGFILIYEYSFAQKKLNIFIPFGKMSLSNYVGLSILGSFLYYNYGLGLFKHLGTSLSLLVGLVTTIVFWFLSNWWLKFNSYGPVDWVWHKLTWIGKK